ncbi:protein of unknown function [Clostridium cavendishii DSM 21758]|uniref:DUF5105 domain-containing protein n=1 Tax=Clostridium cavendishii DSM 21758 TaxID=1121302 RepID=A0A1M6UQX2_9CLOT|nr:DUF5105 domain-containing protein [Clostridium cavendishii]SHK71570.1 protein of unknown function [Clostridium cavendishii DSM 21758]
MKVRRKKLLLVLGVTFLLGGSMVACKEKIEATPTETAQITLDFILKGDKAKVSKVGITDEDIKKFNEAYDKEFKSSFSNEVSKGGVNVNKEEVDKLNDSFKKALAKVEYTVKDEKITDKTAEVNIEFTQLNMEKVLAETEKVYLEKATTNPPKTEEEGMNMFMSLYADEIAKAPLATKKVTKTLEFKQNSKYWEITNADKILADAIDMAN